MAGGCSESIDETSWSRPPSQAKAAARRKNKKGPIGLAGATNRAL